MKKDLILPNFSLGWELEATSGARRALSGVEVGHDGSVSGDGLEYRTARRIVFDPSASLAALRRLSTDPSLDTDGSCGFHVHIGLGRRSKMIYKWAGAFVSLARHIEKEAFEAVPVSRRGNSFCRSWKESRISIVHKTYSQNKHNCEDRYNWVNPVEVFRPHGIRTIEIRLMGDSHSYPYLLSWISFCRLMAQSAWALAVEGDFSAEQAEIDRLRVFLEIIKETFQASSVSSKTVAKHTVYLAHKARLIHPYGNVLHKIAGIEKSLVYESFRSEREALEFEQLMREMSSYVLRVQRAVAVVPSEGDFQIGDTVRCVRTSDYATRGRNYRVVSVSPENGLVGILGDRASNWTVRRQDLSFVARGELDICAA